MKSIKSTTLILLAVTLLFSIPSQSRVYSNKPVGNYKASFDLRNFDGTFLNFMKEHAYPAIAKEAENMSGSSRDFLDAIERGEGVEIKLTDDVSTVHVKFKNPFDSGNPERSGRSFALVGPSNGVYKYVADASYAHYLRTLERLSFGSDQELETFYRAIFSILANSDTSYINDLSTEGKQVAADFVAVYIAEQYRHLINGRDRRGNKDDLGVARLGRGHNWDDAHLQVTLLAAFHGGQTEQYRYMVYEGRLTNRVYDQDECLYRRYGDDDRQHTEKRAIRLKDYWQFSFRSTCPGRSGVNLTRREFNKMGWMISNILSDGELQSETVVELEAHFGKGNQIDNITEFFVNNRAPARLPNGGLHIVEDMVEFVMETHYLADEITHNLIH